MRKETVPYACIIALVIVGLAGILGLHDYLSVNSVLSIMIAAVIGIWCIIIYDTVR